SVGSATYSIRGKIDFDRGRSVSLDNIYTGDVSVSALASLGAASPLAYILGSGFDSLKLKDVSFDIVPVEKRNQIQIASVIAPHYARAGEEIDLSVTLAGENGAESVRHVKYRIPGGLTGGTLNFTVADAASINLLEFQGAIASPPRSPEQVLEL